MMSRLRTEAHRGVHTLLATCVATAGIAGCGTRGPAAGAGDGGGSGADCDSPEAWRVERIGTANLRAVHGLSSEDFYVVGGAGAIFHYAASGWTKMQGGMDFGLVDVWALGRDEVIAVGGALRWDGRSWTRIPPQRYVEFRALWGSADGTVFAIGEESRYRSVLWAWRDAEWTPLASLDHALCVDLWGNSSSDIYAACMTLAKFGGTSYFPLAHYDGSAWHPDPVNDQLAGAPGVGVWIAGPETAYLAAGTAGLWRRDRTTWREVAEANELIPPDPHGAGIGHVGGVDASDVFAVGCDGLILHFDGEKWSVEGPFVDLCLNGIWASPEGEVVIVGDEGTVLRRRACAAR